jgi:hypothetical protein
VNTIMWKARVRGWLHGDTHSIAGLLDRVPARNRLTTRVVSTRFLHAMTASGDSDAAIQALRATPASIIEDFGGTAKGLLLGELLLHQGREPQTRFEFESALAVAG